jgi:hypothetical protein
MAKILQANEIKNTKPNEAKGSRMIHQWRKYSKTNEIKNTKPNEAKGSRMIHQWRN